MNKFLIIFFSFITFGISGDENSYESAVEALNEKKYDKGLNIVEKLIESDDGNDEFYYLASQIYYLVGNLDEANSSILNAIKIDNGNESYRDYQKKLEKLKNGLKGAQKTFDNGYKEDAISEYSLMIKKFPKSPIPYYSLGQVYLKTNNYKLAVENFNKALDLNPYEEDKYNKSIISISQRLAKSGDDKFRVREYGEALDLYLESVEYNPSFVAVLYRITNVYQKIRNYENAKIFAEKTLLYDASHYKSMKTLGDLYYRLGDINNSLKFFNMSISTNPKYYKAYYSLSKVLNEQGNIDEAIKNLDMALSVNPKYDKAYILLGVIYSDDSSYENAVYNFKKAIDIDNKNYETYRRLAEVYNSSEQYLEAKETAKKSLQIKRNYAGAYFELGLAELGMCNKVAAIDSFDKAKKDKVYRKSAKHYLDNINQLFAKNCK